MHYETAQAIIFVLALSMAIVISVKIYRYFKDSR